MAKPTHWTYREFKPDEDLLQGDILRRTEPLLKRLGDVHRHFCDEKYLAFIVVTQSCDLVMRGNACKAKHITLAVVRSFKSLIPDLLKELCGTPYEGFYDQDKRYEAEQQILKIINQNEQAHGMFYLYPDVQAGIAEHAVALLRVSIALRAHEHYALLKQSRVGRLETEFRNKMGWLAGNLYSRVDTPDWADHDGGEEKAEETIQILLDDDLWASPQNTWVPSSWLQEANAKKVNIAALPREEARAILEKYAPLPQRSAVLDKVHALSQDLLSQFSDDQLDQFEERILGDRPYALLVTERVIVSAGSVFGIDAAPGLLEVSRRLPDDEGFLQAIARAFSLVIVEFRRVRGPRELNVLIEKYSKMLLFGEETIQEVQRVISDSLIDHRPDHWNALEAALRNEQPSSAMNNRLRGLAVEILSGSLGDRLKKRLDNDKVFSRAFV